MKKYFAKKPDGFRHYLGRSTLMQSFLDQGASIYSEGEDGTETLIATPEGGFLITPPVFPVAHTIQLGQSSETQEALNIILGLTGGSQA